MNLSDLKADIATLHNICRFNGRVSRFYSVAEHTAIGLDLMQHRGETLHAQRLFAVHDLPESQLGLGDILRDNKQLPAIAHYARAVEEAYLTKISKILWTNLVPALTDPTVKKYDRIMGVAEVETIAQVEHDDPKDYQPKIHGYSARRILRPGTGGPRLTQHFLRLFPDAFRVSTLERLRAAE